MHLLAQTEIILLISAAYVFYNDPQDSTNMDRWNRALTVYAAFDDLQDWALSLTLIFMTCLFFVAFLYIGVVVSYGTTSVEL